MEVAVRPRLVALAVAIAVSLGMAATRAYFVEPKTPTSGWTEADPNAFVGQSFVANVDSIYYLEWFVGEPSSPGNYVFDVLDKATSQVVAHGQDTVPGRGWQWLRCDNFTYGSLCFTKGREYVVKVSHSAGDSVNYVIRTDNPYQYGQISVGGGEGHPPPQSSYDLVCRVMGRLNAVAPSFWGMDEWNFVPWCNYSGWRRTELRQEAAQLAKAAGVGSMMTYARWPTMVDSNNNRSWYDFDARLYSIVNSDWADARPIVNITEVAKHVSSRIDTIFSTNPEGDTWVDTVIHCAPKNLWQPIDDTSNYWAEYIRDLLTHDDDDTSRHWPGTSVPGDFIHVVECWNEPNDSCILRLPQITGWWRRPNQAYSNPDSFGGLPGLCRLYVRLAYVTAEVVRSTPGHDTDKILIGATHRAFVGGSPVLSRGIDFIRYCYEVAMSDNDSIFWDGVSIHPYQDTAGFDPGKFELMAESVRAVARSYGDYDCEVWCSEVGPGGYAGWDTAKVRQYHQQDARRYLPQLFTTALASQALPGARYDQCQWWWYSTLDTSYWYGLTGLRGINLNDTLDVRGYWQPFGSCSTFQTLAGQLTDLRFEQRVLLSDTSREDSARIYEFSDPRVGGKRLWVGWAVDTTGRASPVESVVVPVRTDTAVVLCGSSSEVASADADGWLRLPLSPQAAYVTEVGPALRPDLRADSIWLSPPVPQVGFPLSIYVSVANHGSKAMPGSSPGGLSFRWNGTPLQLVSWRDTALDQNNSTIYWYTISAVPSSMWGWGLFSVSVNPEQQLVELGTDDNDGYRRVYIPRYPTGVVDVVVPPGGKTDAALLPVRLVSHSWESDSTGLTPADSARVVFAWYSQRDTVVHAADTTAWFPFTMDTVLRFPRGCGRFRVYA
jgi:hypothetical protein